MIINQCAIIHYLFFMFTSQCDIFPSYSSSLPTDMPFFIHCTNRCVMCHWLFMITNQSIMSLVILCVYQPTCHVSLIILNIYQSMYYVCFVIPHVYQVSFVILCAYQCYVWLVIFMFTDQCIMCD